ncbi:transmembrane emp24 domain-containing protein p24beta2-like isoform X2 [Tripterygium wilfordii]|uniref:transmembrane emp24 domain-containing protein p24beta2-like isoform X2 n=1 Tax=Tripterygium wilfordii TaxID=458696 RepID=UPI0018F84A51|nr:transmembrane emp24 domain-containing protein p24beta2-like isoform X2 [Tripterygium wilfordii]
MAYTSSRLQGSAGFTFDIDGEEEECFSHSVQYEGDIVHVSFVVISVHPSSHIGNNGVDLVIKGPLGEQIHDFRDKTSGKFEFTAQKRGIYRFCFSNKSPYHETINFDLRVSHFSLFYEHAKEEHFAPLLEHLAKLEEAIYTIHFVQHWIELKTDRQKIVNDNMSRRVIHKAMLESAALLGTSILQVYLLRRLFERKLGTSRV